MIIPTGTRYSDLFLHVRLFSIEKKKKKNALGFCAHLLLLLLLPLLRDSSEQPQAMKRYHYILAIAMVLTGTMNTLVVK